MNNGSKDYSKIMNKGSKSFFSSKRKGSKSFLLNALCFSMCKLTSFCITFKFRSIKKNERLQVSKFL